MIQKEKLNPEQMDYEEKSNRIIKQLLHKMGKSIPEFSMLIHSHPLKTTKRKISISTDGKYIIYNPGYVMEQHRTEGLPKLVYELMHVLLHLLFKHPEASSKYKHREILWSLQDKMVHAIVKGMMLGTSTEWIISQITPVASDYYHEMNKNVEPLQSNTLESYNARNNFAKSHISKIDYSRSECYSDDHSLWLRENTNSQNSITFIIDNNNCSEEQIQEIKQFVQNIVKCFNQSLRHEYGFAAGQAEREFDAVSDRYDWCDVVQNILQQRIVWHEQETIFDRALYTYGFDLYEDIPLIEPCETEEEKIALGGIAIAMDTSGSCGGEMASHFLAGVEQILLEIRQFMSPEQEIVLLQCDSQIQAEELYMRRDVKKGMFSQKTLKGFGGTSFVPVFRYVNERNERNYFEKNKIFDTLIYFTDGEGDFGEFSDMEVDARVIFVIPKTEDFIEDGLNLPEYIEVIHMEES